MKHRTSDAAADATGTPAAGTRPVTGPRPKTEGDVRGLRDTTGDAAARDDQPAQVDPGEANLSREQKAKQIPPPGLMGDAAGPSS